MEVSLHVSLGVLQLLVGDVECSAEWFTAAEKCCLDADMLDVAVALCYVLLPCGKYSHVFNYRHLLACLRSYASRVFAWCLFSK